MSFTFEQDRDSNFRSSLHLNDVKTSDGDFHVYNLENCDCLSLGFGLPKTTDNGTYLGSDRQNIYMNIDQARYFAERLNLAIAEYWHLLVVAIL